MRNDIVDSIKGLAMLLVVLGHTISGTVSDYSNTILYQVIWTLQMPLFITISGYLTRYSNPIVDFKSLFSFIKKRTLAYLLPWVVWTIIIRGFILDEATYLNLKYLAWHMDAGYWFLVTLWTISIIYGITDWISNSFAKTRYINIILHILISGVGLTIIAAIGFGVGINFLAIKLTMFYLPIYIVGYLYGQIQDFLITKNNAQKIINYIMIISLGLWLAAISRLNFFSDTDTVNMIIGRFMVSLLGCIAVTCIITLLHKNVGSIKMFTWIGVHSLEIYLTHYLFLCMAPALSQPIFASLEGVVAVLLNFILTIIVTVVVVKIMQCNKVMNFFLYAKQDKY